MGKGATYLELRKFVAPEFIFGAGARYTAGRYALNYGARKLLLVSDQVLRDKTPWPAELEASLRVAGLPCVMFDRVSPNPRSGEVMAGARLYAEENCNAIIAIGGGSVMDCAKGIGIVSSNGGHILDYEGVDRIERPMPPLICIPTTSGTASEVSQFAIVLDEHRKVKIAIVSKAVVPDVGLVDPEITLTMDQWLTACTGLDALTHAIEAFVSNASSPITDLHALEAVRLIWRNLPQLLENPNDLSCRAQVLMGSLQAGLAFSNAILGAVHAMAHSLGGYLDLPHGVCNAILLGPVSAYNFPACSEKFRQISQVMDVSQVGLSDETAGDVFAAAIAAFRRRLGVSQSLRELGVKPTDIPALAANALKDACLATNPRNLTQRELEELYEKAY